MKKVRKIGLICFFLILCLFAGASLWFRRIQFLTTELSRAFYGLVDQSNQGELDLRRLKSVQWDEIVFWPPYGSICDLGIEGFEKDSPSCEYSKDDGECYLLFLFKNKLVGKVPIDRKRIDLTKSNGLKVRVPRGNAFFIFQTKGDWPRVELIAR